MKKETLKAGLEMLARAYQGFKFSGPIIDAWYWVLEEVSDAEFELGLKTAVRGNTGDFAPSPSKVLCVIKELRMKEAKRETWKPPKIEMSTPDGEAEVARAKLKMSEILQRIKETQRLKNGLSNEEK